MAKSGPISTVAAGLARPAALILSLLAVVISWPAVAVTVNGLYSVEVAVSGSEPEQLQDGYAEGLRQVFVRVSGSEAVLDNEGLPQLLDNAETYLQSYQFLRASDEAGDQGGGEGEEEPGHRLRMSFGAVGVNQALASVGAPVWGANRPLTLAWVAVEDQGSRHLVVAAGNDSAVDHNPGPGDDAQMDVWRQAFHEAAVSRGLPLRLPPPSYASDRELLSDIWGQFTGNVQKAAEPLDHDLMALVRVRRAGGQWQAGWRYQGRGIEATENSVAVGSPQQLAQAVVGRWADMLAERYAVSAGELGESPQVEILINNVSSLSDYARITRVLEDLAPIRQVGASRVKRDQLTLRVAFSGELEQVRQYIALDSRFVPLADAEMAAGNLIETAEPAVGEATPAEPAVVDQGAEGNKGAAGAQGSQEPTMPGANAEPLFRYQPLLAKEEETEESFEAVYPVLHYRWQPATAKNGAGGR